MGFKKHPCGHKNPEPKRKSDAKNPHIIVNAKSGQFYLEGADVEA